MATNLMVFTGNANPELAGAIARHIGVPGHASISKFSDGEVSVELNENVRGKMCLLFSRPGADQRQHHGAAADGRRPASGLGQPNHCGSSLLRLR